MLTSGLRETADPRALGPLLLLPGYPLGADSGLLAGTLKLGYSRVKFARKLPTWYSSLTF